MSLSTNSRPKAQKGFTYLAILFGVAVIGVGLAAVGEVWSTASRRIKERELMYVGRQFREAIRSYYEQSAGTGRRYPGNLEDLLQDPRSLTVKRHLRKLFRDPITGDATWGAVQAPTGGIMGIYSLSEDEPLKTVNFDPTEESFEGKQHYSDWKFIFVPPIPPGNVVAPRNLLNGPQSPGVLPNPDSSAPPKNP